MSRPFKDSDYKLCYERLPKGFLEQVRRRVIAEDRKLLYKRGNKRGYCFFCHTEVTAPDGSKFKQNELNVCPNCGEQVVCFLEDGNSWSASWIENVATLQKGRDGETVFIRQFRIERHKRLFKPSDMRETARYAVREDYAAKWQCEDRVRDGWFSMSPVIYFPLQGWRRCRDVARYYDTGYVFLLPENYDEIREGTCLQYLDMAEFMRARALSVGPLNPIRHIVDFVRYPAVEKLWKAGFKRLVLQKEWGDANSRLIRWKQNDIKKAAPIPWEWMRARDSEKVSLLWVADCIRLQKAIEAGEVRGGDVEHLLELAGEDHFSRWLALARKLPVKSAARYVRKQAGRWSLTAKLGDYLDYLKQCEQLRLDYRKDKSVRYPKDLQAAHARLSQMIRVEENERTARAFSKATEALNCLAWQDQGLMIRPAASPAELKAEGKALHHCVGGYADRMAEGKTAIFFVRKAEEPQAPFFTLEYRDKRIIQCRTLNNEPYENNEQVSAFCAAWLEWIRKGMKTWKKEKSSKQAAR